ncbi:unnamed protein product, partial [Symbiodinium natans]
TATGGDRQRPSSVLFTGVVRSRGMFPPVPSLVPVITPVPPTVAAVTKIAISRVRLDDSWGAHLERRLSAAIQKWVALVVEDPLSFDVGRRCAAFVGNDEAISQGLLHTFSGKSAGTLHSRAGPLIRFVAWAKARQCKPLPFSEALLYDFLLESESTCAPSFGKALMSALAFCRFVLGVENVSDVLSSGRFGGLARSMFLNKRKRRQKPPLTVDMVKALERLVISEREGLKNLAIDDKDELLAGKEDGSAPDGLREDMGIPEGEDFPLLPHASSGLTAANARVFLGCRSTELILCIGVFWGITRSLEAVIQDIRQGQFLPDVTRSGYFPTQPQREPGPEFVEEPSESEVSLDEEDNVQDLRAEEAAADQVVNRGTRFWMEVNHDLKMWLYGPFAMAITESKANFSSRATALGLAADVLKKFTDAGIDCMSKFAFISAFVPGNTDESPFTDAVAGVLGRAANVAELSVLRRLLHESYNLTVSELQVQVERTEDSAPRRLAAPDRADRLQRQQVRLAGLNIHGPTLPGHSVIDRCVQMYEDNSLSYLPLQSCPCRDDEVKFKKDRDDKMLAVDGTGHVSLRSQAVKVEADVSTDLLLKHALTRRGLALDQAGILSFAEHERWSEALFQARFRDPPDQYARVTLQQLIQADRQVFVEAADRTRQGIQVVASGRPVDRIWSDAMSCNNVTHLLQPLPLPPPAPLHPRPGPYDDRRGLKGRGRGKGKGKGKGNVRMPAELSDGVPVTRGLPICFDHNLGRCQRTVTSGKCDRGLHICCIKGSEAQVHVTDDKDVAQLGEELVLSSSDDEIPEGESSPKHVPCSASVPPQPLSSNPEAFASQLLKKPWLEASDVLQLFEMLPMAAPQRGTEGKAFATGAFARVKVGLRTNVAVFPQASRVFASFVRQSAPGHKFTSVVVFEGVRTKPHRDQQNSCVPNLVVPLSSFEKGEIWVATDCGTVSRRVNGQQQKGVLLPVGAGPVLFDARRALHLTEPWKGRRVVLVAFSIGAFSRLSAEASARLSALQFNLPDQSDAVAFQERPQLPVRLPWPPRLPILASVPSVPDIPKPTAGEPLFLELCAGTAMLSRCFHEVGVPVMPIDHQHNRHLPLAKVCNLSLTEDSTWDFLRHLIDTCDILFVHAAPPCGTCSMARHIRRKGVSAGPLRSEQFPMGLPSLNGVDRAKVEAANQIYTKLGLFLQDLSRRAIPWSVENPESSMLWQLPCFQPLVKDNHVFSFDMCCYGGSRLTHRSLLTSCFGLRHFRQRCAGGHEHLPWTPKVAPGGKVHFPTADEAAYPRPFCVQFVALVFRHLGRPLPAAPAPQVSAQASASSARQPRGRRICPVMPEFKRVLVYQVAALPQVDHKRRLLQPLRDAPAGSKLISSTSLLSEVGLSSASETTVQADALVVDSSSSESGDNVSPVGPVDQASACFEVSLGVYASPEEFVEECLNVEHPFDQLHAAPDVLKQCLFDMLTKGPAWVVDRRAKLLKKWTQWARDLEAEEAGLRKSLDPEVAKVLQGKRLLLLEKIASSIGWVDMGVFAELRKGFDLVGHAKHTGVFALEPRPPKLPKDDFLTATKFLRPALLGKVKSSSVDRNARELWEKTMQEVESGMLEGPLSSQQLDDRHPSGWLPTRRFGVEQTAQAAAC